MKKFIAIITLITYVLIGGFGFLHAYQMMEHGHMEMSPCPFMQGHNVICNMNALGHISSWQAAFTAILSGQSLLLSFLILTLGLLFDFNLWKPPDRYGLNLRIFNRQEKIPTLYERLFSEGILNPKAP